jgi:hypothetical protein
MNGGALLQPLLIGSNQRPPMEKEVRGSNQRQLMKKEPTLKCKEFKSKTSDKKRGNPKRKGLKSKTSDEKKGNPKM